MKVTIEHEEKHEYGYFNVFTQHEDLPYSKTIRDSFCYKIGKEKEKAAQFETAKGYAKSLQEPKPVEVVFEMIDGKVTVEATQV